MVFSSLIFLYAFFPVCMLAYALCRTQRAQNTVLLIFSLVFYAWGGPMYLLLLMSMAFVSWYCARQIRRSKHDRHKLRWMWIAVFIDIALIGWFKYAGFFAQMFGSVPEFIRRITLPIGISFYTFQLLTYVVDVYRYDAHMQKSYWNVLLYASLFHQCIAGPIVRYKTVADELFSNEPRTPEWEAGISRFSIGLAKKVLLANPCGALADELILSASAISDASALAQNLSALENTTVLGSWIGVIAYSLHIYLDFSAYSDMAIGMGRMIGLHYLENFNYPYISRTVTEFWRRWHISLGTFFRDYVYIPMGGNRGSAVNVMRNTFVVWALTGLWHGASWNFVLWGLWFFVLLIIERAFLRNLLERIPVLSNLYLLLTVAVGWVIFRFSNLHLMLTLLKTMFAQNQNAFSAFTTTVQLQNNLFLLAASIVAATPAFSRLTALLEAKAHASRQWGRVWDIGFYSVYPIVLLLLSTACLVGDSYNPFIYFQF